VKYNFYQRVILVFFSPTHFFAKFTPKQSKNKSWMEKNYLCSLFSKNIQAQVCDDESLWEGRDKGAMYWDLMLNSAPIRVERTIVRVFVGGSEGIQAQPFNSAMSMLAADREDLLIEYCDVNKAKQTFLSPRELVNWLIGGHIHFILSHVHQGISQLNWSNRSLYDELLRLAIHPGFPNGKYLKCPIFTQDKFNYIQAIPTLCNPTICISLTDEANVTEVDRLKIER
jgi:hypothetical protein